MKDKKTLSIQEDFSDFFCETVYKFMHQNNICIKKFNKEFLGLNKNTYWLVSDIEFDERNYEPYTEKKAKSSNKEKCLSILKEIELFENSNLSSSNILRTLYLEKLYQYVYSTANDTQKEIIRDNKIICNSINSIVQSLQEDKSMTLQFLNLAIKNYGKELIDRNAELTITNIKNSVSYDDFNNIMTKWFEAGNKAIKSKSGLLKVKYLLDKYITDEMTHKKILNKFSNIDKKNDDVFLQESNDFFEVIIDKSKIKKILSFPESEQYNTMHQTIKDFLKKSEVKETLGIQTILSKDDKKSNKFYYWIKSNDNSLLTKDKFQQLLMKSFKDYNIFFMDNKNFNSHEKLNVSWIRSLNLELTLKDKELAVNKKNKI